MKFWIVTPSYNQIEWLKLCIASVADQQISHHSDIHIHHHIQDAQSNDGTLAYLKQYSKKTFSGAYSFSWDSKPDKGMYDAINKGWNLADDTVDLLSYLNCDEQYLPDAVSTIASNFRSKKIFSVLFADAVIVDKKGAFICYRRCLPPTRRHSQVSNTLAFLTCSTFVRASAFREKALFFDDNWRALGDAVWGLQLIDKKIKMGSIRKPTSTFADTGNNMSLNDKVRLEKKSWLAQAPTIFKINTIRKLVVLIYRIRKLFYGGYFIAPFSYSIFTENSQDIRKVFKVKKVNTIWYQGL